jgi:hypothetical protein
MRAIPAQIQTVQLQSTQRPGRRQELWLSTHDAAGNHRDSRHHRLRVTRSHKVNRHGTGCGEDATASQSLACSRSGHRAGWRLILLRLWRRPWWTSSITRAEFGLNLDLEIMQAIQKGRPGLRPVPALVKLLKDPSDNPLAGVYSLSSLGHWRVSRAKLQKLLQDPNGCIRWRQRLR